jgi:hypothetical protein
LQFDVLLFLQKAAQLKTAYFVIYPTAGQVWTGIFGEGIVYDSLLLYGNSAICAPTQDR